MDCPHCAVDVVTFTVPPSLREYAPETAEAAAICPRCLRVAAAESGPSDPSFEAVSPSFPTGEAGVASALLVGSLDSIALNRRAIEELADYAERHGVDLFLTLDRLSTTVHSPAVDLDRRIVQLQQILD